MKVSILNLTLLGIFISSSNAFSPSQMNRRIQAKRSFEYSSSLMNGSSHQRGVTLLLLAAKVGIFFGTSTGNTETVADLIAAEFGNDAEGPFEIDSLQGSIAKTFHEYDALVVGTPTWNTGADTERSGTGWDEVYYGEMQDLKLQGKKVAVFGLGDQVSYTENYADATGELHDVFENLGCMMMGYTSQEGYEHESSKAIRGEKFCGLLCDEINQDDLSPERVVNWVAQLRSEGFLDGGSVNASVESSSTQAVDVSSDNGVSVEELKKENTELRMMLEQNSKMMDEVMKSQNNKSGFTPHYSARRGVTMWTSADGRQCYYTTDKSRNP